MSGFNIKENEINEHMAMGKEVLMHKSIYGQQGATKYWYWWEEHLDDSVSRKTATATKLERGW